MTPGLQVEGGERVDDGGGGHRVGGGRPQGLRGLRGGDPRHRGQVGNKIFFFLFKKSILFLFGETSAIITRAGMVAIPDPERKVDLDKVTIGHGFCSFLIFFLMPVPVPLPSCTVAWRRDCPPTPGQFSSDSSTRSTSLVRIYK